MKKIIIACLAFASCSAPTKEETAHKNVKEYLGKIMNDPKTYEGLEYGSLDSSFRDFRYTAPYQKLENQLMDYSIVDASPARDSIKKLMSDYETNFKPEFIGYRITHRFRASNKLGAIVLNNHRFYLDSNLTVNKSEPIK